MPGKHEKSQGREEEFNQRRTIHDRLTKQHPANQAQGGSEQEILQQLEREANESNGYRSFQLSQHAV